ncbi:uncharacterized protein LY89DRAFT_777542 [Mollisia scopiformis]|uniref:BTB domain-containing protein n=1 Tax=Mollisia scopiformis TaxID=149040 RepID=A0A194XQU5_MOLSC|nr:uncharacterized protein LY89DRAFT_777542 [Mollisia scopiformis]KUJ22424.1 hypothetical protein LY89DRAFT_777542 [Mollisia scopiformis]
MSSTSTMGNSPSVIQEIDSSSDNPFVVHEDTLGERIAADTLPGTSSKRLSENDQAANEPRPKRRKTEQPEVLLKNLRADEFIDKIALYNTPMITVVLDQGEFLLPRGLLNYNSEFFDRALNGYYKEATQDFILLPGCSIESFMLVTRWIYHAQIVLPRFEITSKSSQTSNNAREPQIRDINDEEFVDSDEDPAWLESHARDSVETRPRPPDTNAQKISRLLAFLKLADRIMLLGPFDSVLMAIKELILSDRNCLEAEHVRSAAELPAGHGARKLFAQACLRDYITSIFPKSDKDTFRFAKELEELESFSSDLFQEFNRVLLEKKTEVFSRYPTRHQSVLTDPMDGSWIMCRIENNEVWPKAY